ncbi:MAG: hypothetical protein DRI95_04345 [Bacteroidetes bacterium]|nr:MAG: hypothetical protein DRI95_04345 [Bacteroidota bacterium]
MAVQDISIIEQRKMQVISMMTQLYDIDLLEKIETLLLANKKDWWNSISNAEKQAIDMGLSDIEQKRLISHKQVMKEIDERYKDL